MSIIERLYRHRVPVLIIIASSILAGIWLIPNIITTYSQVKAGDLLDNGIKLDSDVNPVAIACDTSPVKDPESQDLLLSAIATLNGSTRSTRNDAHSHLLLGRAFCYLDKPERAIEHYRVYTEMRPANPLGHLELAMALDRLGRQYPESTILYLGSEPDRTHPPSPSAPTDHGKCEDSVEASDCRTPLDVVESEDGEQISISTLPSSWIAYQLELPPIQAVLVLPDGLQTYVKQGLGDEVTLTIRLMSIGWGKEHLLYEFQPEDRPAKDEHLRIDLSSFAGTRIDLIFEATPGVEVYKLEEFVRWIRPEIRVGSATETDVDTAQLAAQFTHEVHAAGYRSQDLMAIAERELRIRNWHLAWLWYQRALIVRDVEGSVSDDDWDFQWTHLVNADFSVDSGEVLGSGDRNSENGIPDGWIVFAHNGSINPEWVTIVLTPSSEVTTGQVLTVTPLQQELDLVIASNPVIVNPGRPYTAGVHAYRASPDVRGRLEVLFRDSSGNNIAIISGDEILGTGQWEILRVSGVSPKQSAWLMVRLRVLGKKGVGHPVQFTNVHLETSSQ